MLLVVLLLLIAIYTHSGRIQKIQQEGTCPKEESNGGLICIHVTFSNCSDTETMTYSWKFVSESTMPGKWFHEIDAFQHYDQFEEKDVLNKRFIGYLHYCKASAGCPDISWLINNHEKKCGIRIAEFPQLQNLKDEIAVKVGRRRVKRIDYRSYPQGGTFARVKPRKVTPPSNQSQLIIRTVKSRFVEERLRRDTNVLLVVLGTIMAIDGYLMFWLTSRLRLLYYVSRITTHT